MTKTSLVNSEYLSDLEQKIHTLPPDEASYILLEASSIILFAGFPELAYQGFLKLTEGELKLSKASTLVGYLTAIIPALCYFMEIPCPSVFSKPGMSLDELEIHLNKNRQKYEKVAGIDRWFQFPMPSGDWSEEFLYELTHPQVDIKSDERFKVFEFIQDLHRVISQCYVNRKQWQGATKWLKVFEDIVDAWELDNSDCYHREILVFGIRTYLHLGDNKNADRFIQKWWQSLDYLIGEVSLLRCLPPKMMQRLAAGALRNQINISQEQAQEFVDSVNRRKYIPPTTGFIPTVDDWKNLLEKWNQAIFDNLEEEDLEYYERDYPDVFNSKSCLQPGAIEEEIAQLETKLAVKLPLSYRNFLLASNGFTILDEYSQLYGTNEIKWFIEENRDTAEFWDREDEVEDEEYFLYGKHQGATRYKYMKTALQISETEDGYVYLLNPKIIDSRNEWEAWDFGTKHPGAYRYRSFWEMIEARYQQCLNY